MMKKSILCAILVCCNILLLNAESKQYVGVQLGFTQPITRLNAPVPDQKTTLNTTIYNGLKIGAIYDATIIKGFGYAIGINYTFGGNHTDWRKKFSTQPGDYPKIRTRGQYHQLELVVDWQYKFEIAKDTWLILYTGPTIQCGLNLSDKWYVQSAPNTENFDFIENHYDVESAEDYAIKRLNVTWGIGAGFQYERYFIRGGYDFGLVNPYKAQSFNISDDYQPYTRGRFDQWQIKVGMYLWEF